MMKHSAIWKGAVALTDIAPRRGKKLAISLLKTLACILVAFNHTENDGFFLFSQLQAPLPFALTLMMSILCKIDIPLFFMCSGALLLNREESLGTLLKHRVLRIIAVLALYSLVGYLYLIHWDISAFDWHYFLTTLYGAEIFPINWFLYAYLAMLLMLPLLRKMAKALTNREMLYLIGLQLLFGAVIPAIEYVLGRNRVQIHLEIPLLTQSIFYALLGYFAQNMVSDAQLTKKNLWIGVGASLLCVGAAMVLTVYKGGVDGFYTENQSQLFHERWIAIPSLTIYLLVRKAAAHLSEEGRFARIINHISGLTFGIYLLHIFGLWAMTPAFEAMKPVIGTFPAMLVWLMLALVSSGLATEILKRLPLLRKLL